MKNEINFALYALKKNLQNSAELRTSFLMSVVGMMLNNISFIVIWTCFVHAVGTVNGWTVADIFGLMGFLALGIGAVFSVAGGIGNMPEYVANGSFDRFLLSPKNLIVRVAVAKLGVASIGDFFFGIVCLGIYIAMLHIAPIQILFIVVASIITIVMSFAVLLFVCSLSFHFSDPNTAVESVWEFFMTPSLFHGGAFQGWVLIIFTFFIPSLVVGALPVELVKSISWTQLGFLSLLTFLWLLVSIRAFYTGLKKYESANLVTFGS